MILTTTTLAITPKEEKEIQKVDVASAIGSSACNWVQIRSSPFLGAL
jgi:hypothetical protein